MKISKTQKRDLVIQRKYGIINDYFWYSVNYVLFFSKCFYVRDDEIIKHETIKFSFPLQCKKCLSVLFVFNIIKRKKFLFA